MTNANAHDYIKNQTKRNGIEQWLVNRKYTETKQTHSQSKHKTLLYCVVLMIDDDDVDEPSFC